MELTTKIAEINGSFYVRIPANMARYFKVRGKAQVQIKDIDEKRAEIEFPT